MGCPARSGSHVRQRFREAHRDAGADRGGEPDEEGWPARPGREGGGEQSARVETEPSIRPASPGCTICSTKSRRSASCSLSRIS